MGVVSLNAQVLTLDECRQMALQDNKTAQIDQENVEAAKALKNAALSNFFPTFSANGGYMFNSMDVHLLAKDHEFSFGTANYENGFTWKPEHDWSQNLILPASKEVAKEVQTEIGNVINEQYSKLYDDLTLDVKHVLIGQVGVTQPIFLGGKIYNTYRMAESAERLAEMKAESGKNDIIWQVDEAYWRVVSVEKKKALAQQYYDLLVKLDGDVAVLVEEGLATRSDQLKVKLKLSEAEEKLGQATDGLELSRMALCQIIGKPLDYEIHVDGSDLEQMSLESEQYDVAGAADRRDEVRMLTEAQNMAHASKMLTASTLMPNIVAQGNYMMANRNFDDGIQKKYNGWWSAGVVVNIPIAHASDIYKVKAAKHTEQAAQLKLDEVREMISLQATQSEQKVAAARRKLIRTQAASANALEVLRMAQESFAEGVVGSTDLMAAETQWQSAESDRIDAAIELKMAELTYRKNTGNNLF